MTESKGRLSSRGIVAAETENPIWDIIRQTWHPELNAHGYVNLGVAENALLHAELLEFIHKTFCLTSHSLTYGDGPAGSNRTRQIIARFLNRHFHPARPVEMHHVLLTDGVTTGVEASAFALADPGNAFLLARPYYQQFPSDMGSRADVKTIGVSFGSVDPFSLESVAVYESALLAARDEGVKVAALLLCSPHNPLGRYYGREVLLAYMKFCQKYRIHFLVDEIYALSVFHNQDTGEKGTFTSVLSIDTTDYIDPALVHVLWGLSKDFGANGLRAGVVVSQSNPSFIGSVYTNAIFHYPSAATDAIVANILGDDQFVDAYIQKNQALLSEHHKHVATFFQKHDIPYYAHTTAAFFIWFDLLTPYARTLGRDLATMNDHDCAALSKEITTKMLAQKVFCAAGESYGTERPGWFRIIFTQSKATLDEGLDRVVKALDLA